jgi:histidinol dehydrogenase
LIIQSKQQINTFLNRLKRRQTAINPEIELTVREILTEVKTKGDTALKRYTRLYDGHKLPIKVDITAQPYQPQEQIDRALKVAIDRIRIFHRHQLEKSWTIKEKGAVLGQIITPLKRVGVYVPGGKASYPSTVLMNVIPAQVAGVKEIALCVPTPQGEFNPVVMRAIQMLGITEVYRIGGAQAIAAMAYGTESIKKVDKIVGPGNIYVATAKRMVFGEVDIDMIAGPSEILIIADGSAEPMLVAADMLSQAEHDEAASSILITDSRDLANKVKTELQRQLHRLPKMAIAQRALKDYGAIIVVEGIEEAAAIANEIAPEHLEIITERPRMVLPLIKNAGAIFLGKWSPEPLGDYCAGPNHTLPTGGTARFSSPLGTYDFLKRSSLIDFTEEGFLRLAPIVEGLATLEGLEAHAETVRVRQALSSQAREGA